MSATFEETVAAAEAAARAEAEARFGEGVSARQQGEHPSGV